MGDLPKRFGDYMLLELVATGGMAEVFKAKAFGVEGFERIIAVKRILSHLARDEQFIEMFVDEATLAAQLNNPHIVQIYELGTVDDQYFMTMEYVAGRDMRQILTAVDGPLPIPHAAYVTSCVCKALDHAHNLRDADGQRLNVVHRDVNPQNVLCSFDGEIKVADFGIAKAENRLSKTQAGDLKGKVAYMAPEQSYGSDIDHRVDVFGLGLLLFELATGQKAYTGKVVEIYDKVRRADVASPGSVNPSIPSGLESIILRALAVDPDDRYPSTAAVAEELDEYLLDGSSVFSAKQMAAWMQELFAGERERESRQTQHLLALTENGNTEQVVDTLVYETQILATGATHWRSVVAEPPVDNTRTLVPPEHRPPQPSTDTAVEDLPPEPRDERLVATEPNEPIAAEPRVERGGSGATIAVLAAVFVGLLVLLTFLLRDAFLEEPPPASSHVIVVSEPAGAEVSVDGRSYGPAPAIITTTDPTIRVRAAKPGFSARETTVTVTEQEQTVRVVLDPDPALAREVNELRRTIATAMAKKGIIAGDDANLDVALAAMDAHTTHREVIDAGQRALDIARKTKVGKRFVMAKLERFNSSFDRTDDPDVRAELQGLARAISASMARRDFKTANRQLNTAFQLLAL